MAISRPSMDRRAPSIAPARPAGRCGQLGIEIRSALHTGEVELIGSDVGGITVHTAARVLAEAQANEVWTSRTVKDLVAGSRFKFFERGTYTLKGVAGDWPLFTVEP